MPQRAKAVYGCPTNLRSAARGNLVVDALTDDWRSAGEIAREIDEHEELVRYQLAKLVTKKQAEREARRGTRGPNYFYRSAR